MTLPPADTMRWTFHRKAAVIEAIAAGTLSRRIAVKRYGLTAEELEEWQRLYQAHGARGLRTTRLLQYRGRR